MSTAPEIDHVQWSAGAGGDIRIEIHARAGSPIPDRPPELITGLGQGERSFPASGRWPPPAAPAGGWNAAFTLPLALRGSLDGGLALRAGDAQVALPVADALPPASAGGVGKVVDPTVLAERRARRAELGEETLARRVAQAEAEAHQLHTQLGHLEQRLTQALEERDRLSGDVAARERELRVVRQGEYSEQQLRVEAEAQRERVEREAKAELASMRRRLADAERRAQQLAAELQRVRRMVDEAQQAAATERGSTALHPNPGARQLQRELESAQQALENERRGRAALEAALAGRERRHADELRKADEELAAMRAELDHRAAVREQVGASLSLLRAELDRLRSRVEEDSERTERDDARVRELEQAISGLRGELEVVERQRRDAERSAEGLSGLLAQRDEELRRLTGELERHAGELALTHAETCAREQAATEAEQRLSRLGAENESLRESLARERVEREAAEHELHQQIARERVALGQQLAATDRTLRTQMAEQREQFEAQMGAVEATIAGLRAELTQAAIELEERLRHERTVTVQALQAQRDAERAAAREAQARRPPRAERDLGSPAAGGHDLERQPPAAADAQARRDLTDAQAELQRLRAAQEPSPDPATGAALVEQLSAAIRRLRERVPEALADPGAEEPASHSEPEARPTEPAGGAVLGPEAEAESTQREPESGPDVRPPGAGLPKPTQPEPSEDPASGPPTPSAPQVAGGEPARPTANTPEQRHVGPEAQAGAVQSTPRPAADFASTPSANRGRLSAQPAVRPRRVTAWLVAAIEQMVHAGEAERAGRLIVELLPAQRARVTRGFRYRLQVGELAPLVVSITEHGVRTTAAAEGAQPGGEGLDFSLSGPAGALAPLGAGGAGRRLAGAQVGGRRRRLRQLLKAMRAPVTLEEFADARLQLSPELVLAALVRAVDPAWTAGHSFDVAYAISGPEGVTVHQVEVRDGSPLTLSAGSGNAAATVTTTPSGLIAMLAGRPEPPGGAIETTGDSNTLAQLGHWLERAQGGPGVEN